MLPQIDIEGQQKLLTSTVMIVGLGGLGSPVALYLAAAGVGHLILVDFDTVELSNLQRQIIHTSEDIDRLKVDSARDQLLAINPECKITLIDQKLSDQALLEKTKLADVVVDCSDNFPTRFSINKSCFLNRVPLVSAAAIRFEGQLSVFDFRKKTSPCYRCLYHDEEMQAETCSQTGVVAPLLGMIGSMQALETIKVINETGELPVGKLVLFDGLSTQWRTMTFNKNPACPVCQSDDR